MISQCERIIDECERSGPDILKESELETALVIERSALRYRAATYRKTPLTFYAESFGARPVIV